MSPHADEEEESISENLSRAKLLMRQSETFLKWAVLRMADAEDLGASETEIAEGLGRSAAWLRKLKKTGTISLRKKKHVSRLPKPSFCP